MIVSSPLVGAFFYKYFNAVPAESFQSPQPTAPHFPIHRRAGPAGPRLLMYKGTWGDHIRTRARGKYMRMRMRTRVAGALSSRPGHRSRLVMSPADESIHYVLNACPYTGR